MKRLEALADAIAAYNGSRDPESPLYQARNPLMLKDFRGGVFHDRLRRFEKFSDGYNAALFDLEIKCSGKSRARLDDFTIQGLIRCFSLPSQTSIYVVRFLRKALKDNAIKPDTELTYFMENGNGRS